MPIRGGRMTGRTGAPSQPAASNYLTDPNNYNLTPDITWANAPLISDGKGGFYKKGSAQDPYANFMLPEYQALGLTVPDRQFYTPPSTQTAGSRPPITGTGGTGPRNQVLGDWTDILRPPETFGDPSGGWNKQVSVTDAVRNLLGTGATGFAAPTTGTSGNQYLNMLLGQGLPVGTYSMLGDTRGTETTRGGGTGAGGTVQTTTGGTQGIPSGRGTSTVRGGGVITGGGGRGGTTTITTGGAGRFYTPGTYSGTQLGQAPSLIDEHGGINYGMLPGLMSALWGISYPQGLQSATNANDLYNWMTQIFGNYPTNMAGNQAGIINQLLGLSGGGMPANASNLLGGNGSYGATDALSQIMNYGLPNQGNIGNIAGYFSNMATSGGLTPQYVNAMNTTVYQPMMEQLLGNINSMSGGTASLDSPLSQELQRKATNEYMANLTAQGFNNMNQQAQTATNAFGSVAGNAAPYLSMAGNLGLGIGNQQFNQQLAALNAALGGTNTMQSQLLGGLEQLLGGQQQYGLGQQGQSNDMVRQLIAMYALQHPQTNSPGAAGVVGSILSSLLGGQSGSGAGGNLSTIINGIKRIFGGGGISGWPPSGMEPDMSGNSNGYWNPGAFPNEDLARGWPYGDVVSRLLGWENPDTGTWSPADSDWSWLYGAGTPGSTAYQNTTMPAWEDYWNQYIMGQNPFQYMALGDPNQALYDWLDSLGMYNYA